ncbi:sugar phosphate isomerase/epimerase [Chitinophaga sp. LS1]|uniref:sugar phosphate isomerase/epimerase family protein n=1 Tax=Chitinophaga sp. LS1 TaxID=3051176 RepID=UPI002AABDB7A|nr:sugar phosphate isomerase/epimerase [Chitinophaga sp. LS1]WPV67809.1 sugar phosphate isomerase/epimerase [Chitinophaga sp. LS1]
MKIQFFCPRWGSENLSWKDFMIKAKAAGYDGIEYAITSDTDDQTLDEVWNLAEQHKLLMLPQHFDTCSPDFNEHYDLYAAWLEWINPYPFVKINSQTGRDIFTFEQNNALIDLAGPKVVHELHRGKFSFAAHVTKEYLKANPELKLTFDISHWVAVAESFLGDQQEAVQLAIERAQHIHARVGYPEGPQIPDPRLPEWQEAVKIHLGWWTRIAERFNNDEILTITTEFGPFPYLVHDYSQWDINLHMMSLLKKQLIPSPIFSPL